MYAANRTSEQSIQIGYAISEIGKTLNMEQLQLSCRLCLCPEQDVLLFSDYKTNKTYAEVALSLANINIKENDNLPKKICVECASKLVLFHKFKKKCELSHITLVAVLELNEPAEQKLCEKLAFDEDVNELRKEEENNEVEQQSAPAVCEEIDEIQEIHTKEEEAIIVLEGSYSNDKCEQEYSYIEVIEDIGGCVEYISDDDNDAEAMTLTPLSLSNRLPPANRSTVSNDVSNTLKEQKCWECNQVFSRKSTLIQHQQTHSGVKRFICSVCENRFTRKAHLQIHMRIHEHIKPYVCQQCDRSFTRSSDLVRHQRIHTDERNYSCIECSKRFKRSNDVITHMRVHTKARPYGCTICDKSYSSHSSLKKHIFTHSRHIRKSDSLKSIKQEIEN